MPNRFPPIRTVFFDMGNVLVRFSHEQMLRQLAPLCNSTTTNLRHYLMDSGFLAAFERGEFTETQFIEQLESQFQYPLKAEDFRHAFSDIFSVTPGIMPLLEKTQKSNVQLILLSNTSVTHLEFVERNFDVLNYMHARTTSFEAQACKPDAAIYRTALEMAGCAPEECFYTDDIADYIAAAGAHGIRGTQFIDSAQLEAELHAVGILASS